MYPIIIIQQQQQQEFCILCINITKRKEKKTESPYITAGYIFFSAMKRRIHRKICTKKTKERKYGLEKTILISGGYSFHVYSKKNVQMDLGSGILDCFYIYYPAW